MASSLLSERGVSPVNPESKQMRGRPDCQSDRPGMNKGQSIEDRKSPDWSQRALAGRDSTPDIQFSHRQATADAAVQIPHPDSITKPCKPAPKPTATAAKPHDTWKAELMAGMALLAQQQRKELIIFFQSKHFPNALQRVQSPNPRKTSSISPSLILRPSTQRIDNSRRIWIARYNYIGIISRSGYMNSLRALHIYF
jgi:hypothetical protein